MLLLIIVERFFHKLFLELWGTFGNFSSFALYAAIQTDAAFLIAKKGP